MCDYLQSNFSWNVAALQLLRVDDGKEMPFKTENVYGDKKWSKPCLSATVQRWVSKPHTKVRIQFCEGYFGTRVHFLVRVSELDVQGFTTKKIIVRGQKQRGKRVRKSRKAHSNQSHDSEADDMLIPGGAIEAESAAVEISRSSLTPSRIVVVHPSTGLSTKPDTSKSSVPTKPSDANDIKVLASASLKSDKISPSNSTIAAAKPSKVDTVTSGDGNKQKVHDPNPRIFINTVKAGTTSSENVSSTTRPAMPTKRKLENTKQAGEASRARS